MDPVGGIEDRADEVVLRRRAMGRVCTGLTEGAALLEEPNL